MLPPVAVMFDWCNTIVRKYELDADILREVLESMQQKDVDIGTLGPSNIAERLARILGNEKWRIALARYEKIANQSQKAKKWPLSENILELLTLLHNKGIQMAVVSNKEGGSLREEVHAMGLSKYFAAVVGSGDTPEDKPSPKPIIAALEILGIPPGKQVFFVGDSISDVESARMANCLPIIYASLSIKGVLSFTHFKEFSNLVKTLLD